MELISKRGALQAIAKLMSDYDCDYNKIVEKCRDAIKELPVHSEKCKKGKWIAVVDKWGGTITIINGYKCSECSSFSADKENYCSNCGTKMEIGE